MAGKIAGIVVFGFLAAICAVGVIFYGAWWHIFTFAFCLVFVLIYIHELKAIRNERK